MGKDSHQSTIELNGQRYNAHTGKLIDGVRRMVRVAEAKTPRINHQAKPSKLVHKTPQRSKTLMRRAVQKPMAISARQPTAMDVVPHKAGKAVAESFHHISNQRIKRAESVPQNSLISRFADFVHSNRQDTQVLSDKIAPATVPVRQPLPAAPGQPIVNSTQKSLASHRVLEKGLRSAESHLKPASKKARLHHRIGKKLGLGNKAAGIVAGSVAVLLLGAFFAYQNIPNINVRYAATKSGVHGGLPGYQPSGFAVNDHINYSAGKFTISYKANADNRSYDVTQQNTSWDSEALKNYLASRGDTAPQTYPSNGRTIYLHGNSSADWVAGGIWYSISGDASLNTNQLIKIASSI